MLARREFLLRLAVGEEDIIETGLSSVFGDLLPQLHSIFGGEDKALLLLLRNDGQHLVQIETVVLQEELVSHYLQQRLLQLLTVYRRDQSLSMQVFQQPRDFSDRLNECHVVIAEETGHNVVRLLQGVISVLGAVSIPTNGPGIFLLITHIREGGLFLFEMSEGEIEELLLQFSSLADFLLDGIKHIQFLDDAVVVDEVDLLLQMEDGQFLQRQVEDQDRFDGLPQQVQEGVVCQLQVVLVSNG